MKIDSMDAVHIGTGLQEWQRGWRLVLAATLGVAVCGSYFQFIGAMIKPLQDAYGWSRGEIALGLTLITSITPFVNLGVGALADRFGARRIALWGSISFGLSFCAWGLAGPALWTWYALSVQFAIFGHLASMVVWSLMVVKHFHLQRGLALALTLSGSGLAVAVTPTLVILLNQSFGVHGIFWLWGCASAAIMFIPALLFFRDPGANRVSSATAQPAVAAGYTLRAALRDRRFWQLALSMLLVALAIGTFIVHLQPMLLDSGLTPAVAASVALFIGPSMIAGRILMGLLFDRLDARLVSALAFALPAITCVLLGLLDGSYALAAIAGVVTGLGLGAEMDVVAYLTSRYFGMRSYGKIFAILSGLYGFGIGAGSALSGALFDATGNYGLALTLLAISASTAVVLVSLLGPSRNNEIAPPGAH